MYIKRKEYREKRADYQSRVNGPGKFEGEEIYSPYFYDIGLDDGPDEIIDNFYDYGTIYLFKVMKEDRALFPELKGVYTVSQVETNDGFINTNTLNREDTDIFMKAMTKRETSEDFWFSPWVK